MDKQSIGNKIKKLSNASYKMATFIVLLLLYMGAKGLTKISKWRYFPEKIKTKFGSKLSSFYLKAVDSLEMEREGTITRINLIELATRNMMAKRTRTFVTVGGMTIGIATIVFLVSIGYGLQELVINRVARLEEMKQTDVTPQAGGKVKIDDKTISNFKDIQGVGMSLPLIAVVGKVNYQNSVSDMAVYGVTTDFLKQSAIQPVYGKIFESNDIATQLGPQIAGIATESGEIGDKIQDVNFSIEPGTWIRVREGPDTSAQVLGYTKRVEGTSQGEEVWGSEFLNGENKWVKAPLLLWSKEKCDTATQGDCEDGNYIVMRDTDNSQIQKTGYFAEIGVTVAGINIGKPGVLGLSTDWVDIASEAGTTTAPEVKTVTMSSDSLKEAVVNKAMLAVLGIKDTEAVGKKFNTSFIVVGDLLSDPKEGITSSSEKFTIVGVTPDAKTPVFYVPFVDLRALGIVNYSQVKVVANNQAGLPKIRRQIEAMGYITRSVADTVAQINSLFATARTLLILLGMVALGVAALGMFNTLTVSLLERTREVGLMKAMGMKSSEVSELFLTESMIMGFLGGILGIIVGWILGKLVGIFLSFFAIFKGVGFVDVSYIPFSFVFLVLILSLIVGIATGIYPAKRATKISALDALRYE